MLNAEILAMKNFLWILMFIFSFNTSYATHMHEDNKPLLSRACISVKVYTLAALILLTSCKSECKISHVFVSTNLDDGDGDFRLHLRVLDTLKTQCPSAAENSAHILLAPRRRVGKFQSILETKYNSTKTVLRMSENPSSYFWSTERYLEASQSTNDFSDAGILWHTVSIPREDGFDFHHTEIGGDCFGAKGVCHPLGFHKEGKGLLLKTQQTLDKRTDCSTLNVFGSTSRKISTITMKEIASAITPLGISINDPEQFEILDHSHKKSQYISEEEYMKKVANASVIIATGDNAVIRAYELGVYPLWVPHTKLNGKNIAGKTREAFFPVSSRQKEAIKEAASSQKYTETDINDFLNAIGTLRPIKPVFLELWRNILSPWVRENYNYDLCSMLKYAEEKRKTANNKIENNYDL